MNKLQKLMFVDSETLQKRLEICSGCLHKKLSRAGTWLTYCDRCHCPLRAKTVLKRESCPLGKWPDAR